jgi:hypothetical protein
MPYFNRNVILTFIEKSLLNIVILNILCFKVTETCFVFSFIPEDTDISDIGMSDVVDDSILDKDYMPSEQSDSDCIVIPVQSTNTIQIL